MNFLYQKLRKKTGVNVKNFIPKTYQKDQITVRLNVTAIEKIDKIAAAMKLSRSELINQCVEFALENMSDKQDL